MAGLRLKQLVELQADLLLHLALLATDASQQNRSRREDRAIFVNGLGQFGFNFWQGYHLVDPGRKGWIGLLFSCQLVEELHELVDS